jgi:hypothetical protein
MKKVLMTAALIIPIVITLGLGGCLLEDRTVQIVLNSDHCEEFPEDHGSDSWTRSETVELGEDLDQLLADNEISVEDIDSVFVTSGTYDVIEFPEIDHDWTLTGAIQIERTDISSSGPITLIASIPVSVEAEYHSGPQSIPLEPAAVALINQALEDYLNGAATPEFELSVVMGNIEPDPTPTDRIVFTWKACLLVQVVTELEVEVVNWLGGS